MQASLPKFASNLRQKGAVEENQAVIQGTLAYFGSYIVGDTKEQMVNLHIEGRAFPNWDGQDQKRYFSVAKDELKLANSTPSIEGGTYYSIWKRGK